MIIYPEEAKLNRQIIFDSHAHYDDNAFDEERITLLNELNKNGVCGIITCAVNNKTSKKVINLANKFDFLYCAVGIHPENINDNNNLSEIKKLSGDKKCVAIGEIGLDYNFDDSNKEDQKRLFEDQIILAKELNLPIIVHDRDAHFDTLELLKKHKPKGVVHCFSGSEEMAQEILKIGMYIGIGGVVTFKNAKKLPDVVKIIPNDKLLIETDCPYLSPEPFRGKICHSGLIPFTAQKIGELKGISRDTVLELTLENAKTLFNI